MVSDLTPTLLRVLRVTHCQVERGSEHCKDCSTPLDVILSEALSPLQALAEMHSTLPLSFSLASSVDGGKVTRAGSFDSNSLQPVVSDFPCSRSDQASVVSTGRCKDTSSTSSHESVSISAAAAFFVRAAQRLSLTKRKHRRSKHHKSKSEKDGCSSRDSDAGSSSVQEGPIFPTNFSDLIMRTPPQAPPNLFKHSARRSDGGKVKVMVRVSEYPPFEGLSCVKTEPRKKQLILRDPTGNDVNRRVEKAPRLYSFDSMFDSSISQSELCSAALVDLLLTVINGGEDACLLVYGHPGLGKTHTMVGTDDAPSNVGLIPCAISWLYQLIDDRKERTGARFSVRISALEVVGKSENLKDLLAEQGGAGESTSSTNTSPSAYLPRERAVQLSDFTELRAPTAEKASFYLDAALASRSSVLGDRLDPSEDPDERRNSNLIITLHVYQYLIDKVGTGEVHGGRSRLHLIDLSGCKRGKRSKETGDSWLTLSSLSNVIVALANGAKHIPHRDSKLTMLLRECIGSLSSRITLLSHVSGDPEQYSETLSTLQTTARIHRSRRKKKGYYSTSSSGGDSSCDESKRHRRRPKPAPPMFVTEACESDTMGDSEFTTSAAEESCDTVIYVGPKGEPLSDRELTDFEGPPPDDHYEEELQDPVVVEIEGSEFEDLEINSCKNLDTRNPEPVTTIAASTESNVAPWTELPETKTRSLSPSTRSDGCLRRRKESFKSVGESSNSSYQLSPEAKEALDHPASPFYRITHGCSRTGSKESMSIHSSPERTLRSFGKVGHHSQHSSPMSARRRGRAPERKLLAVGRAASLDRHVEKASRGFLRPVDHYPPTSPCGGDIRGSMESISSQGTVDRFEANLVSKIAERFALQDEFQHISAGISSLMDKQCSLDVEEMSYDEYIGPTSHLDIIPPNTEAIKSVFEPRKISRDQATVSPALTFKTFGQDSTVPGEQPSDQIIIQSDNRQLPVSKEKEKIFFSPSADTESLKGSMGQLDSYSSCGSLVGTPKNGRKSFRPTSEGISSGYESMRGESSANIAATSDSSSEKGRSPKTKRGLLGNGSADRRRKKQGAIPETESDTHSEEITDRSRFAKPHKSHVKKLMKERDVLKQDLKSVLGKLVTVDLPLPDVDERLKSVSLEDPQALRVLNRENRILQRKINVCKQHLQLVTSFDANPSASKTTVTIKGFKTTAV